MTVNEPTTEIRNLIQTSLRKLLIIRKDENDWNDKGKAGPGLLKSLEALEAILTPVSVLNDLTLPPDGFPSTLIEDLKRLIEIIEKDWWVPEPYLYRALEQKCEASDTAFEKQDSWCIDAASFTVTTFIDAIQYMEKVNASSGKKSKDSRNTIMDEALKNKLLNIISHGTKWIVEQAIDEKKKGHTRWSWGNRAYRPSLYFTYSASVALGAFINFYDDLPSDEMKKVFPVDLRERAEKYLLGAYDWALQAICQTDETGNRFGFKDPALKETEEPYEEEAFLGWAMGILEAYSTATAKNVPIEKIEAIGKTMTNLYETGEYQELFQQSYYHTVELRGQIEKYEDRTLIYLAVRGLSWIISCIGKGENGKNTDLYKNLVDMLMRLYQNILNEQDPDTKLWTRGRFEIYRTQRSLEALSYLIYYVGEENMPKPQNQNEMIRDSIVDVLSDNEVVKYLGDRIFERFIKMSGS